MIRRFLDNLRAFIHEATAPREERINQRRSLSIDKPAKRSGLELIEADGPNYPDEDPEELGAFVDHSMGHWS